MDGFGRQKGDKKLVVVLVVAFSRVEGDDALCLVVSAKDY